MPGMDHSFISLENLSVTPVQRRPAAMFSPDSGSTAVRNPNTPWQIRRALSGRPELYQLLARGSWRGNSKAGPHPPVMETMS